MTQTILRLPKVQAETGASRSTVYLRIQQGLFTKPVRLGQRSVGWPASEIAAIIAKQCGTSPEMIQRHYDHLTTLMHVKALVGSEGAELTKLIKAYAALE